MSTRGLVTQAREARVGVTGSPPATRASRSRWRDPRLVVGIVLVAASALLGARLLGGADDTVTVWATRHRLSEGQAVTGDDLVRREVRFADQAAADRYVSADDDLPDALTLSRPVGAGELVPRGALGSAGGGALTEVPLSVNTEAVPATVRVGAVVDVWVTPDAGVADADARIDGPRAPRSTLLFDDVAVVSALRGGTSLGPSATRQVIVGIGSDQEGRLPSALAALAGGTVLLTVQR